MSGFSYQKDNDGIVTITMDMNGPVNAMNSDYREQMGNTLDVLEQEPGLTGVVIASAKSTFFAGGDLNELLNMQPGGEQESEQIVKRTKAQLRRLENLAVPVVAVINGAALGGGFEICLACNRRIIWDSPKAIIGLPEVTLGLLPGAGGVVRLVHLLGLEKALPLLLEGNRLKPESALREGLAAELVEDKDDLIPRAKSWIKANPDTWQQPWDQKGHKIPGGSAGDQSIKQLLIAAPALLRKKTRGLLPAPERILAVAAETLLVDFDTALNIESHALTYLALTPVAKNMITSTFFQMNKVTGGHNRPKNVDKRKVKKVGILAAGMMEQGIAEACENAGVNVVFQGIKANADYQDLAQCELIIEVVSEGVKLEASARPEKFIGIHFLSPFANMPLVEIICGSNTDDETLALAFDFSRQIGKTPIIVNDSQGFFTSRVSATYLDEGLQLLQEGVTPFMIDRLAEQIGMLVSPLTTRDELSARAEQNIPYEDIKDRLLFRQVIESLKCLEEGVLRSIADGNVGSLLGIGAPIWTGGFIQFVNTYGLDTFIARTQELADQYGERFLPPAILIETEKKHAQFV